VPACAAIYNPSADLPVGAQMGLNALTALCICFTICTAYLMFRWRNHRVMHASSPKFMGLFVFGIFILFCAAFAMIQPQSTISCAAQPWLFHFGFTVSYGSLFAKTWRLHKIFNNEKLVTQVVSDTKLFLIVGLLLLFDAVVLIFWFSTTYFEEQCTSLYDNSYNIIFSVKHGLVLVAGASLTFLTRSVPTEFNECRWIGAAVHNTVLVSILWLVVAYGAGSLFSQAALLLTRSLLTIWVQLSDILSVSMSFPVCC
jgi:gamma-aminobutyric acid type B receptor